MNLPKRFKVTVGTLHRKNVSYTVCTLLDERKAVALAAQIHLTRVPNDQLYEILSVEPLNGSEAGSSLGGRIGAWRDTLRIVRDSPYTGTGLNTFGTAMVLYQTGTGLGRFQEAHNDYLQIAAEGGLLIGIPVLFTLGVFVWNIRRRFHQAPKGGSTYWIRIGAVIGLILIALQSLLEFSLQMPGNAALFALVAALAVHQSPHLRRL